MNWDRTKLDTLTIFEGATIRDAMSAIQQGGCKTVFVITENYKLVGVIGDADIRRGLLNGSDLSDNVAEVINRSPLVLSERSTHEEARNFTLTNKRDAIPIITDSGELISVYTLIESIKRNWRENEVVLMAGGKGERLLPLTKEVPKPMIPVGAKPMLEHVLESLIDHGFCNFTISINYLGESIKSYFGDGKSWGVNIRYVQEDEPLGTAGALSLFEPKNSKLPFIIMNCDVVASIDYDRLLDAHQDHCFAATMCVTKQEVSVPFGVVEHEEHELKQVVEKPSMAFWVNAGVYAMSPSVLSFIDDNEKIDMPDLFERVKKQGGKAGVFPLNEYWLDIGTHQTLGEARKNFKGD